MIKKYIYFMISVIIFVGCDGPFNPFGDSAGKEVFPINIGDTWTYAVQSQNSTTYQDIARIAYIYIQDTTMNDVKMTIQNRIAYYTDSTIKWTVTVYHVQDDFGFYSYLSPPTLEQPVPYLIYPIYKGRKWNFAAETAFLNDYDKLAAEVIGKEDVGNYTGCWKVSMNLSKSDDDTYPIYVITSWYKEDIGLVKMTQEVGSVTTTITLTEKTFHGE
jgi:hypothetical protein